MTSSIDYSALEPAPWHAANGRLAEEYVKAGAARNKLPLCWGIDWIGLRPRICRRTARRGSNYCDEHKDQEEEHG